MNASAYCSVLKNVIYQSNNRSSVEWTPLDKLYKYYLLSTVWRVLGSLVKLRKIKVMKERKKVFLELYNQISNN